MSDIGDPPSSFRAFMKRFFGAQGFVLRAVQSRFTFYRVMKRLWILLLRAF
jgi:hypothetical protein